MNNFIKETGFPDIPDTNSNAFIQNDQVDLHHQLVLSGIGSFTLNTVTMQFNCCARFRELLNFQKTNSVEFKEVIKLIKRNNLPILRSCFKSAYINKSTFECEFEVIDQHQKTKWFLAKGKFAKHLTHSIFHGILSDVTKTKEKDSQRNEILAMLNHELRTPLTTIKLYVQLVAESLIKSYNPSEAKLLKIASNQVDSLTQIIEDFLILSTMNNDKLQINNSNFEINELISEVVSINYSRKYPNEFHLEADGPLYINADRLKITQVLHNYLSNAIKYSSTGSNVTIICKSLNHSLVVCIKDNGLGIDPEDQKKLFDKFFRSTSEGVQRIKGHGIGLYLVKKIINAHHGNVWANSRIGKGSAFYFSIPLN